VSVADRSLLQADQADAPVGRLSGTSANAVRWQVWTALLVYLLLRYLAFLSEWSHSFSRLFTLMRVALWKKWDGLSLLAAMGQPTVTFVIWPDRSKPICRVWMNHCGTATGHFDKNQRLQNEKHLKTPNAPFQTNLQFTGELTSFIPPSAPYGIFLESNQ